MSTEKRIGPLDGLRTFAAFGVVWIHSWTYTGNPSLKLGGLDLYRLIAIVGNGVDFFFVISGFFMFLVVSKIDFSASGYWQFIRNRWLRIAPAFYFSAVVYAIYYFIKNPHYPAIFNLATNLSFLGNIFMGSNIIGPFWSLGTEWHFYLILPFLFLAGAGSVFLKRLLTVSVVSVLFFLLVAKGILNEAFWKPQVITRFIEFGWGALAGYGYKNNIRLPRLMRGTSGLVAAVLTAYAGRIFMTTEIRHSLAGFGWILNGLSETILTFGFAWLMYHAATEKSRLSDALSGRVATYLGKISYSVYLWHSMAMIILTELHYKGLVIAPLNTILVFLIVSATSILIAHYSYRFFEEPYFRNRAGVDTVRRGQTPVLTTAGRGRTDRDVLNQEAE